MNCGNIIDALHDFASALGGVIGFASLPKKSRSLVFYSEGESYYPHLHPLLSEALENSQLGVSYVSSSRRDPGLAIRHKRLSTFFVGRGFIRNFFFETLDTDLLILTMPDLENHQIKRSRRNVHYAYTQHSLASLHMIYNENAFDHFDTIFCAGPHHVTEVLALEAFHKTKRKNIVPLGYPRIDSVIEDLNRRGIVTEQDRLAGRGRTVLIAPSWGPNGLIESGSCLTLLEQLLNGNFNVIVRPHPQTPRLYRARYQALFNRFRDAENVRFEEDVQGYGSMLDADLMVSDWSGVALEFSFCFGKPVIFCELPRKINNVNYESIGITPPRSSHSK